MPLDRKDVIAPGARLLEEIVELLGRHPDKVFSSEEITEIMEKDGLVSAVAESPDKRYLSIVEESLRALVIRGQVVKYPYQGDLFYGVAR